MIEQHTRGWLCRLGLGLSWLAAVLSMAVAVPAGAAGKPKFRSSELEGKTPEICLCDLDGDGLADAVVMDGATLTVFYQEAQGEFGKAPQHRFSLPNRPCALWPASLGGHFEGLLVMTSEGVDGLSFTNRSGAPVTQPLVRAKTIVPPELDELAPKRFPFAARTGGPWPLLLAPTAEGLQVWHYREGWRLAQTLKDALDTRLWPSVADPGYTKSLELSLSLADLNGDGREDLMLRRKTPNGRQRFTAFLQTPAGGFAAPPAVAYEDEADGRSWHGWVDINRDGKVDLLRNTWLDEPWFLPGTKSGKVLVRVYYADTRGGLPAEPQQVFRKNDWTPAVPVVDVDGDGHPDLVLGHSLFDSRDGMRKMITAKQLDFNLTFHFYRPGLGFPKDPDCQRDLLIHLDQPSLLLTYSRRRYFEQFVSLAGDFDGDGRADLLVRDRADQLSAYFFVSRERGFDAEPDLRFGHSGPLEWFAVEDLNRDGISDLVLWSQRHKLFRIYLSQKK
jgi:hypothetical protein